MESGSRSSACRSIRRDGTVVSPSEDGLRRQGTRRDCKGDVEYSPKQPNRAHTCYSRYRTPRTGYAARAAGLWFGHTVGTHYCLAVGNDKGLELDETDEDEELCESDEEEVEIGRAHV